MDEGEIVRELRAVLRSYGLAGPLPEDLPMVEGLGLDGDDWDIDAVPEIEAKFGVDLRPLLLTGEILQPGCVGRLLGIAGTPLARDVSIGQVARYIYEQNGRG